MMYKTNSELVVEKKHRTEFSATCVRFSLLGFLLEPFDLIKNSPILVAIFLAYQTSLFVAPCPLSLLLLFLMF